MASLAVDVAQGLSVIPAHGRPAPHLLEAWVSAHERISPRHWRLAVTAPPIAATAMPGQFLMVTVARAGASGHALPRPMAISRCDGEETEFVYGVVGAGTRDLTAIGPGEPLTIVGPLGQPFSLLPDTRSLLVIGRGIGSCSLTMLARAAAARGARVTAVDSAQRPELLVGAGYFAAAGTHTIAVTDEDASSDPRQVAARLRGLLDAAPPQQIAVCGSARLTELARSLGAMWGARVEVSIEAHMACGLGYCHGCSRGTRSAAAEDPLVCKDGPVFWLPTPSPQELP